jgi:hypothetical protein
MFDVVVIYLRNQRKWLSSMEKVRFPLVSKDIYPSVI